MGFFYAFLMTLLSSFLQAAVLVLLYKLFSSIIKNKHARQNTSILFTLIGIQLLSSTITFYCFYNNKSFTVISANDNIYNNSLLRWCEHNAQWLVGVYGSIVAFKAVQIFLKWQQFKHSIHNDLCKPSVDIKLFTQLKSLQLGIRPKVQIWLSNNIITPITYGFLKPVIVLPIALINQLNAQEVETIILHELSHIKNNDYIFNWMLIIVETLFCFNPFVQYLLNKIKLERELHCDTQVIHFKYDAVAYAQTLLKVATYQSASPSFHLKAVQRPEQLLQRIKFFNNHHFVNASPNRKLYALPVLGFIILLCFSVVNVLKNTVNINNAVAINIPITSPPITTNNTVEYATPVTLAATETAVAVETKQVTTPKNAINAVEEIVAPNETNVDIVPVAYNETPDSTKTFIYNVETPKGMVQQVFKLTLVAGVWQYKNVVTVYETRPDSLLKIKIDTIKYSMREFQ